MRAVIERCIIKGRFNDNYPVDGIYYGTISDGHFINTVSVYKILLRKKYQKHNGTINFGLLSYQPGSRNLWGDPGTEIKRSRCEIKWRSFKADIINFLKFKSNSYTSNPKGK
jgi:hypothetical protein